MSDPFASPRFALPLLAAGQSQKEITHNEALSIADALLHPAVESDSLSAPPLSPQIGLCWLLPANPTGVWAGKARNLAQWTAGGWRFCPPIEGMSVWHVAETIVLRYRGGQWLRPGTVAFATGGSNVDAEARAALAALVTQLILAGILAAS